MSTTVRLGVGNSKDQTDRVIMNDFQDVAYASSLAIAVKDNIARTRVRVAQLTGSMTVTANVGTATTGPQVGDEMEIWMTSDATTRTVTFSTGFLSSGAMNVTGTGKIGIIGFVFNGTAWVERYRTVTA